MILETNSGSPLSILDMNLSCLLVCLSILPSLPHPSLSLFRSVNGRVCVCFFTHTHSPISLLLPLTSDLSKQRPTDFPACPLGQIKRQTGMILNDVRSSTWKSGNGNLRARAVPDLICSRCLYFALNQIVRGRSESLIIKTLNESTARQSGLIAQTCAITDDSATVRARRLGAC